jgi:hypothetical protein
LDAPFDLQAGAPHLRLCQFIDAGSTDEGRRKMCELQRDSQGWRPVNKIIETNTKAAAAKEKYPALTTTSYVT